MTEDENSPLGEHDRALPNAQSLCEKSGATPSVDAANTSPTIPGVTVGVSSAPASPTPDKSKLRVDGELQANVNPFAEAGQKFAAPAEAEACKVDKYLSAGGFERAQDVWKEPSFRDELRLPVPPALYVHADSKAAIPWLKEARTLRAIIDGNEVPKLIDLIRRRYTTPLRPYDGRLLDRGEIYRECCKLAYPTTLPVSRTFDIEALIKQMPDLRMNRQIVLEDDDARAAATIALVDALERVLERANAQ